MANVKLSDLTKEIGQRTGEMLKDTENIKKSIDVLLSKLRKQETQFKHAEEEENQRKQEEEKKALLKQQTKAWTMPDDEEKPANEKGAAAE